MRRPLPFAAGAGPHNPRICPWPHFAGDAPPLAEALAGVVADFEFPRGRDALRSLARSAPLAAAALVFLLAIVLQLARDTGDTSEIQLVLLQTPRLERPIEREVAPKPPPLPEPEPVAPIAKAPEIVPPPPKPVPVRAEPEPRPAPVRKARRPRPEIVAQSMPAPEPVPAALSKRAPARVARPATPTRRAPPVQFAAARRPVETKVALPTRAEATRPFRTVAARSSPRVAPLAPTRALIDAAPASPRPTRAARRLPIRHTRDRLPAPLPVALPASDPATAQASREPVRRRMQAPVAHTRTGPAKPDLAFAAPAAPMAASRSEPVAVRAALPAASPRHRRDPDGGERLSGVPLGSLPSCVSDREETALKQALLSSVKTQKDCANHAGYYRFLQTKNLNAFLMWVDPAPTRAVADRCIELAHALDCVKKQNIMESRRR